MQFFPDHPGRGVFVVPEKGIHETQQGVPSRGVYQLINLWQRIAVFRVSLVQIREVHTHSPCPVGLLHQNHIGDLFRLLTFSNESCIQQLMYFCVGRGRSLWAHVTILLDNWPMEGVHIQLVLHNVWSDAGNFLGSEGEHILVLSHKSD